MTSSASPLTQTSQAVPPAPASRLTGTQALASDAELAGPFSLDGLAGVHDAVLDGARLRCEVDNASLNEMLRRLSATGVRTLTCRPPTLEELFLRHYAERSEATVR